MRRADNMTMLHMNLSERATAKVLFLLDQLSQEGEEVELLDDKIYNYEKIMIDKALKQLENNEFYSAEEVKQYLANEN